MSIGRPDRDALPSIDQQLTHRKQMLAMRQPTRSAHRRIAPLGKGVRRGEGRFRNVSQSDVDARSVPRDSVPKRPRGDSAWVTPVLFQRRFKVAIRPEPNEHKDDAWRPWSNSSGTTEPTQTRNSFFEYHHASQLHEDDEEDRLICNYFYLLPLARRRT